MIRTAAVALVLSLVAICAAADEWSDWKDGRATYVRHTELLPYSRPTRRQQLATPSGSANFVCFARSTALIHGRFTKEAAVTAGWIRMLPQVRMAQPVLVCLDLSSSRAAATANCCQTACSLDKQAHGLCMPANILWYRLSDSATTCQSPCLSQICMLLSVLCRLGRDCYLVSI